MANIKNAVVMGNIYDPDTDCQYILMRCSAKDFDDYQREIEEEMKHLDNEEDDEEDQDY